MKDPSGAWTYNFREQPTGEPCSIFVRIGEGHIFIGLSRMEDGDIEVALSPDEARLAAQAISNAADQGTFPAPE